MLCANFNLSPQGDGNPFLRMFLAADLMNFNLSPQGDGNVVSVIIVSNEILFQLIPARGRKREPQWEYQVLPDFNLSPQGDKKLRIKKDAEFFFCKP